ncbi:MAG: class I SAM-dependent methyltransferase [Planctomycetia bacterium]|nr:class I SAM-dependent methyltransferase [Planctomycetia bacterium]
MDATPPERPTAEDRFAGYYAAPRVPWDIGRPQRAFVEAGDAIHGRVLDCGCGTGDLSIWLAGRGCTVTGVDFLAEPLARARRKAAEQPMAPHGGGVTFLRMDALAVGGIPERFDAVTDCGLFHTFDDAARAAYVRALATLLEPGARLFLLCFSDAEPGSHGPRRVSDRELRMAFADGWEIEKIEPTRFETVPGIPGAEFTPGGPRALFAVVRRT